ncbi:MAG: LTA synthase family protein, partial [Alloprevotella tannerae]|nr:LTA synthase family protein [Alloprevotella tannerae]
MKQRLILLLKTFGLLILFFVLMKPVFMLYHRDLYVGVGLADYFRVVWHGLPMDASVAGYFTALPALLLTLSVWERARLWADRVRRGWTVVMAVLLSIIYIVDLVLYGFWKFRLDTTPIFYFTSSPKDAFASVSVGYAVVALLACCAFGVGLWWLLHRYLDERLRPVGPEKRKRAFAILL